MSEPKTSERGALFTGRCLCGAIQYEVSGPPATPGLCHCTQCRLGAGATPVAWATFQRANLAVRSGQPSWYRSSPPARRAFCGTCGCSLFFESDNDPNQVDITIATLDQADEVAPQHHIWTRDKLAWVTIADGLPAHASDEPFQR